MKTGFWKVTMKGGWSVLVPAKQCEFYEGGFVFKAGEALEIIAWFNRDEVASVERGEVQ